MKKIIISLLCIFLCSCSSVNEYKTEDDFNTYIQSLPSILIDSSSTIVNQFFKNETQYGFEECIKEWPEYDLDEYLESLKIYEDIEVQLDQYSRKSLSDRNKIVYDLLDYSVSDLNTEIDDKTYYYMSNSPLSYYQGEMSSIALVFMFFNLNDQLDVDSMIHLAETLPDFVNHMIDFEQERQDAGYGMTPREIELSISSFEDILTKDYTFIIDDFENKLMETDFIKESDKLLVLEEFSQLIHKNYPLAFRKAIDGLKSLDIRQKNIQSLSELDHGSDYYMYLIESKTGFSDGDEYLDFLEDCMNQILFEYQFLYQTSDPMSQQFIPSFDSSEPNEMLEEIKYLMSSDFPALKDLKYEMSYLPEGLEELMPNTLAFYKNSSYDDTEEKQMMMLNGRFNDFDFNTIAHEGYPGHMYQRIYNIEHSIPVIQDMLAPLIYSEGYATYVADYASKYSNRYEYDKMVNLNNVFGSLLYLEYEYRVNVLNEDISNDFSYDYGVELNSEEYEELTEMFIMYPSVYVDYYVGYMEFMNIRDEYFKKYDEATDLNFHTDLLNLGPLPLSLLKQYMLEGVK